MELREGVFEGLSFDKYLAIPAINQSGLKAARSKSWAYWKWLQTQPRKSSDEKNIGVSAHSLYLTPATFSEEIAVSPKYDLRKTLDRELKAGFESINQYKLIINEQQLETSARIVESACELVPSEVILKGRNELTLVYKHRGTGVWCKARLDNYDSGIIRDLKTTRSADPGSFPKHAEGYGYFHQAAWYRDSCLACGLPFKSFNWIAVESSEPFFGATYSAREEDLNQCSLENDAMVYEYAACRKADVWPGYESGELARPHWAAKQYETEEAA